VGTSVVGEYYPDPCLGPCFSGCLVGTLRTSIYRGNKMVVSVLVLVDVWWVQKSPKK